MKQKLTVLLSRMALILFGILFALIILEIAFRILYPDPSPKLVNQGLQFDEVYGLAFTPNVEGWNSSLRGEYSTYIKINSKGLRSNAYPYEKADNTFRILVLGDSFTAALQVRAEETFSKRLEAHLQAHYQVHYPQLNIEVINAGVIGYGTDNQLAYFIHEGYKYQPDLVLLAFFSGNDITDNVWYSLYELNNGDLISVGPTRRENEGGIVQRWGQEESSIKQIRQYLYTHSRLYSVSIELLTLAAVQRIPGLVDMLVAAGLVEITRPVVNHGNIYAFRYLPDYAWDKTEALILALKQEVEAHNSQLVVAILPDETDVDEKRRAEILTAYADLTIKEVADGPSPTQTLGQRLQAQDILHVQLLPALQGYHQQSGEQLYYRYDGHWTPAGHAITEQVIYDYFIKHQAEFYNFPTGQ